MPNALSSRVALIDYTFSLLVASAPAKEPNDQDD
jgi:hypothetical protein